MNSRLRIVRSAFAAFAATVLAHVATAAAARPNILLIVGDDMGYADVGFHGCKDIPTPHLDALAASGVRFTNGYVSGPYCSPTRAGLLTGRYQQRFGHEFNGGGEGGGLPLTETTIANRLKSAEFFGFLGGLSVRYGSAAPCATSRSPPRLNGRGYTNSDVAAPFKARTRPTIGRCAPTSTPSARLHPHPHHRRLALPAHWRHPA